MIFLPIEAGWQFLQQELSDMVCKVEGNWTMPSANTIVSTCSIMPPIWVIPRGVLVFSYLTVKFAHKGNLILAIFY